MCPPTQVFANIFEGDVKTFGENHVRRENMQPWKTASKLRGDPTVTLVVKHGGWHEMYRISERGH